MRLEKITRNRLMVAAAIFLALVVLAAALADSLAPYDPGKLNVRSRLQPPGAEHLLGTDGFGRDVLSRLLFGARLSLSVGGSVVVIAVALGTLAGVAAAYFRRLDEPIMRTIDAMMAFPEILLAIALIAALGASFANVVISLAIVYTPRIARIVRASALVIAEQQFVEAATGLGAAAPRIILRHLLPNLVSPIIVQGTFIFAYAILAESSLSFLGVGVPPELPTWGNMINEGRPFFAQADWLMLAPGIAIVLTVFALQSIGDGIRDLLDPRLRSIR
jgi:ABC-type dipeptide/oligopeptide/nickel transport systems, permease components